MSDIDGNIGEARTGSPLIEAALVWHANVVDALLRHGADRSAKDAFGRTAVEAAGSRGWASVLLALRKSR